MNGAREINFDAANPIFGALSGNGNITLTTTAGSTLGSLSVGSLNAATLYSGVLSGAGGIALTGGMLTLGNAANTFTGNIYVNGGTLSVTSGASNTNNSDLVHNSNGKTVQIAERRGERFVNTTNLFG